MKLLSEPFTLRIVREFSAFHIGLLSRIPAQEEEKKFARWAVENGKAIATEVEREGKVALIITSMDGKELVLWQVVAEPGMNLTDCLDEFTVDIARRAGAESIRIVTMREEVVKAAVRYGFRPSEIVLRKGVPHVGK